MKNLIILIFTIITLTAHAESIPLGNLKSALNPEKNRSDKVLLYFWASWCPDCKEKLSGEIQKLEKEFPKISILTINGDRELARGLGFASEKKLLLPIYRDEEKTLSKSLKIFSVPAWAYLEKQNNSWVLIKSANGADLSEIRETLGRK